MKLIKRWYALHLKRRADRLLRECRKYDNFFDAELFATRLEAYDKARKAAAYARVWL